MPKKFPKVATNPTISIPTIKVDPELDNPFLMLSKADICGLYHKKSAPIRRAFLFYSYRLSFNAFPALKPTPFEAAI